MHMLTVNDTSKLTYFTVSVYVTAFLSLKIHEIPHILNVYIREKF